jgi:hypothetical protein
MPFTVASGQTSGSGQSITLTIAIPAHSVVGVVGFSVSGSNPAGNGSCVDSNSVAYSVGNVGGTNSYAETFYTLDSGSVAASLIFTAANGGGSYFGINVAAWVITPAGPTSLGSTMAGVWSNPSTSPNGLSTGNLSIVTTDGIILGYAFDQNANNLTAGTAPLMTVDSNVGPGGRIQEHALVSTASPATWTCSGASDFGMIVGLSFQSNTATVAWLT